MDSLSGITRPSFQQGKTTLYFVHMTVAELPHTLPEFVILINWAHLYGGKSSSDSELIMYCQLAGKRKINLPFSFSACSLSLIISELWACERKVNSFVPESRRENGTHGREEPCSPTRTVLHNINHPPRKGLMVVYDAFQTVGDSSKSTNKSF